MITLGILYSLESSLTISELYIFSTDRNFTGKAIATQLTNTSYQCQLLQDTFALIQLSVILGTVSEWKFTELNVSGYSYELSYSAMPIFESQFSEAFLVLSA